MSKPDLTNIHYLTSNRIIGEKRLEKEVRNNMKQNKINPFYKLCFAFLYILYI